MMFLKGSPEWCKPIQTWRHCLRQLGRIQKSRVNRRKSTKNLCVLIEFFTRNSAMYGTSTSHQILPQYKHCKLVLRFSQLSLFYEKQTVKMQLVPQFLSYRVRTGLI